MRLWHLIVCARSGALGSDAPKDEVTAADCADRTRDRCHSRLIDFGQVHRGLEKAKFADTAVPGALVTKGKHLLTVQQVRNGSRIPPKQIPRSHLVCHIGQGVPRLEGGPL